MVEGLPPWLRLQSCHPGFESQENHLQLHQFIKLCNVEKTKINKKRPGLVDVKIQHYLINKIFLRFLAILLNQFQLFKL